jgi:methyl-accepting chemotaxis protein
MSNLIVVLIVGVIGIIGLILISHKIAGPLYRFEKGVAEVSKGDLSYRFRTRKGDQLTQLSESLNSLTSMMDSKVEAMNLDLGGIAKALEDIKLSSTSDSGEKEKVEQLSQEVIQRVNKLKDSLGQFNTSQSIKKKSNLQN